MLFFRPLCFILRLKIKQNFSLWYSFILCPKFLFKIIMVPHYDFSLKMSNFLFFTSKIVIFWAFSAISIDHFSKKFPCSAIFAKKHQYFNKKIFEKTTWGDQGNFSYFWRKITKKSSWGIKVMWSPSGFLNFCEKVEFIEKKLSKNWIFAKKSNFVKKIAFYNKKSLFTYHQAINVLKIISDFVKNKFF